ncbi:MAG: hypothetical protein H6728_11580 [Myxococcales bacterium]|nr:hypothetical protein [Myxococcales bacterium]
MNTWLHQFFGIPFEEGPFLELQFRLRDTILYQTSLAHGQSFSIGRSAQNDFALETPLLPMEQFTLVQFHAKGALIQFTSTMRGSLQRGKSWQCLEDLKHTHKIHPTPQGYRLQLPLGASLFLHLDDLQICLRWSLQRPPWDGQQTTPRRWSIPTPNNNSLGFARTFPTKTTDISTSLQTSRQSHHP